MKSNRNLTKSVTPEQVWSVKEIEGDYEIRESLGHDAADFERLKFRLMRQRATLSESSYERLFNSLEPVQQLNVGNCYLISALYSLFRSPHCRAIIRVSVREVPGGWEVKIPLGDPNGTPIFVSPADLQRQPNPNRGKPDWRGQIDNREFLEPVRGSQGFQILEVAYSRLLHGKVDRAAIEGGHGSSALTRLLGSGFDIFQQAYDAKNLIDKPASREAAISFLDSFHPGADIATAETRHHEVGHDARYQIPGVDHEFATSHAYAVIEVARRDLTPDGRGKVVISNPWNANEHIILTYDQFLTAFSSISSARLNHRKLASLVAQRIARAS